MTIPKAALVLAIKGGWAPTYTDRQQIQIGTKTYPNTPQIVALDRTFWVAIASARGVQFGKTFTYRRETKRGSGKFVTETRQWNKGYGFSWKKQAQRFYDLILTGGDTDKFWAALLAHTK